MATVEKLPLRDVLILRDENGLTSDDLAGLAAEWQKLDPERPLLIGLPTDMGVESLDEDMMRDHGWVRARALESVEILLDGFDALTDQRKRAVNPRELADSIRAALKDAHGPRKAHT